MLPKSKIANAAGVRDDELTIQIATDGTANSMGEVTPVFETKYNRFCEVVNTSGREFIAALAVQPMLNAIIKIPYDSVTSSITSRDRIVDGDVVYNISEIVNESNEKMVAWCVKVD